MMPAAMAEPGNSPSEERLTFTGMIVAWGATPAMPTPLRPAAMMPATCVP